MPGYLFCLDRLNNGGLVVPFVNISVNASSEGCFSYALSILNDCKMTGSNISIPCYFHEEKVGDKNYFHCNNVLIILV